MGEFASRCYKDNKALYFVHFMVTSLQKDRILPYRSSCVRVVVNGSSNAYILLTRLSLQYESHNITVTVITLQISNKQTVKC